jgi:hypothetical protein
VSDRIAEIRARLDAGASDATHWRITEDKDYSYRRALVMTAPDSAPDNPFDDFIASGIRDDETADFIARAPADIAWLLDALERERKESARLFARLVSEPESTPPWWDNVDWESEDDDE